MRPLPSLASPPSAQACRRVMGCPGSCFRQVGMLKWQLLSTTPLPWGPRQPPPPSVSFPQKARGSWAAGHHPLQRTDRADQAPPRPSPCLCQPTDSILEPLRPLEVLRGPETWDPQPCSITHWQGRDVIWWTGRPLLPVGSSRSRDGGVPGGLGIQGSASWARGCIHISFSELPEEAAERPQPGMPSWVPAEKSRVLEIRRRGRA